MNQASNKKRRPRSDHLVRYTTKSGNIYDFDISKQACDRFGFYPGTRVITPKGAATVIGVQGGFLWFHIDSDPGASYWDNCRNYEDLLQLGVYLIDSTGNQADTKETSVSEDITCSVCMEQKKNTVFMPCRHCTCCAKCAQQLNECPICRTVVNSKIEIFL